MASILTICWLIFPLGQLLRLEIFGISFPLFDLFLGLLLLTNLRKIKINAQLALLLFIVTTSSLLNLHHPFSIQANFYLLRFSIFLLLSTLYLPKNSSTPVYIAQIVFTSWGLIQYYIWPNNILLSQLGWDPHTNRLIGSLLDPTYTGLVLTLFIFWGLFQQKPKFWLLMLNYVALALTYSRSSLFSLYIPLIYLLIKNQKIIYLFGAICLLGITIWLLPKPPGESTNLSRSNSFYAKIDNYKEGFQLFRQSPILGVGINNLGFYRHNQGHASWGYDNSLLTIACTTGLFGLILCVCYVLSLTSSKSVFFKLAFTSCLIHSFFSNSLLNPWVVFLLLFLPPPTAQK